MYVKASPGTGSTADAGLGFDFGAIGDLFSKVAPVATQVYAAKAQVDMQTKLMKAQAAQQAAINQAAMYPPSPYPQQYQQTYTNYGAPGSRGAGIGDGLPTWVMPAAIAGGVGLLALVMLRR